MSLWVHLDSGFNGLEWCVVNLEVSNFIYYTISPRVFKMFFHIENGKFWLKAKKHNNNNNNNNNIDFQAFGKTRHQRNTCIKWLYPSNCNLVKNLKIIKIK